jgi:hypothetical protein
VTRQQLEDLGRRRGSSFQQQIVAIQAQFDTGGASRL